MQNNVFSTFSVGTELSILLKLGLELGKVKQLLGHFEVVTLENKNLSVFILKCEASV